MSPPPTPSPATSLPVDVATPLSEQKKPLRKELSVRPVPIRTNSPLPSPPKPMPSVPMLGLRNPAASFQRPIATRPARSFTKVPAPVAVATASIHVIDPLGAPPPLQSRPPPPADRAATANTVNFSFPVIPQATKPTGPGIRPGAGPFYSTPSPRAKFRARISVMPAVSKEDDDALSAQRQRILSLPQHNTTPMSGTPRRSSLGAPTESWARPNLAQSSSLPTQ